MCRGVKSLCTTLYSDSHGRLVSQGYGLFVPRRVVNSGIYTLSVTFNTLTCGLGCGFRVAGEVTNGRVFSVGTSAGGCFWHFSFGIFLFFFVGKISCFPFCLFFDFFFVAFSVMFVLRFLLFFQKMSCFPFCLGIFAFFVAFCLAFSSFFSKMSCFRFSLFIFPRFVGVFLVIWEQFFLLAVIFFF